MVEVPWSGETARYSYSATQDGGRRQTIRSPVRGAFGLTHPRMNGYT